MSEFLRGGGGPHVREMHVAVRGRTAAVAVGAAAVVVGGVMLALGLTLIAGLAVVGTAAGGGTMLFRRLSRRPDARLRRTHGLDPAQEVFPVSVRESPQLPSPPSSPPSPPTSR